MMQMGFVANFFPFNGLSLQSKGWMAAIPAPKKNPEIIGPVDISLWYVEFKKQTRKMLSSKTTKNEFAMPRLMLSDELWSKLRIIMREHGIYDKPNLRMMVEGMLYRMRTGLPWPAI